MTAKNLSADLIASDVISDGERGDSGVKRTPASLLTPFVMRENGFLVRSFTR